MPRVVVLADGPPVTVADAGQAFGSNLRLRLIRHYLDQPGPQKLAVEALGASTSVISSNTHALMALGVVLARDGVFSIDQDRLAELRLALIAYLDPPKKP